MHRVVGVRKDRESQNKGEAAEARSNNGKNRTISWPMELSTERNAGPRFSSGSTNGICCRNRHTTNGHW